MCKVQPKDDALAGEIRDLGDGGKVDRGMISAVEQLAKFLVDSVSWFDSCDSVSWMHSKPAVFPNIYSRF